MLAFERKDAGWLRLSQDSSDRVLIAPPLQAADESDKDRRRGPDHQRARALRHAVRRSR